MSTSLIATLNMKIKDSNWTQISLLFNVNCKSIEVFQIKIIDDPVLENIYVINLC